MITNSFRNHPCCIHEEASPIIQITNIPIPIKIPKPKSKLMNVGLILAKGALDAKIRPTKNPIPPNPSKTDAIIKKAFAPF